MKIENNKLKLSDEENEIEIKITSGKYGDPHIFLKKGDTGWGAGISRWLEVMES